MRSSRSRGISETVSTAIAAAFVVAISIAVLTYLTSTSNIARQQEAQSLNKEQLVLRSMIGADYVYYPDWRVASGYGVAKLRNTGDVTVTVLKIIVYRNGTPVHDTNPGYDPAKYVTLGRMEAREVYFMCPGCRSGDPVLVTVHYVPTALIDPSDPSRIEPLLRTMLFRVASFKAEIPNAQVMTICPPPEGGWLMVDYVDPVESPVYEGQRLTGFLVEGAVKLRIGMASDRELEPTKISVVLRDVLGNTASGSVTVSGSPPVDVLVPVTGPSPLRYPLTVSISSDSYTILPGIWRFNVDSDLVFPDFAKLNVDRLNMLATSMLVSVYAIDDADVLASVSVIDCQGRPSGRSVGSLITLIPGGADYLNLQGTADISPPAQVLRLYDVTIEYKDVTEIFWVTETVTVTETTTETLTSTTTTTVPSTVTTFTTFTTTITRYRVTGTSWTTTTISKTATEWTTTTTTTTRTRYTYTTVYTATITRTRSTITTIYTSTMTLSRTSTISSTSTLYSPTITQTITRYTSVYTTTRTITETRTVGTTVTTTTTVTVTTTVTPGGSSVPPVTTAEFRPLLDPSLLLLVTGGLGLMGISSPIIYRTLRREGVVE